MYLSVIEKHTGYQRGYIMYLIWNDIILANRDL